MFCRWLRIFSWRSGVPLASLIAAGVLFWCFKDPWVCRGSWKTSTHEWPPGRSGTFSPDGRRLLLIHADGSAAVHDSDTGVLLARMAGVDRPLYLVAFSPDGKSAAGAWADPELLQSGRTYSSSREMERHLGEAGIAIWDARTGQSLGGVRWPCNWAAPLPRFLTFSLDGGVLHYSDSREALTTVDSPFARQRRKWELDRASFSRHPIYREVLDTCRYGPTGQLLLCQAKEGVFLVEVGTGRLVHYFQRATGAKNLCSGFVADSRALIEEGGFLSWMQQFFPPPSTTPDTDESWNEKEYLHWKDLGPCRLLVHPGTGLCFLHNRTVNTVSFAAFSPDMSHAVIVGPNEDVSIWELAGGRRIAPAHQDRLQGSGPAVWSPSGDRVFLADCLGQTPAVLASARRSGPALICARTGRRLARLPAEEAASVTQAEFSSDGRLLLTVAADGTACLWARRWELTSVGLLAAPTFLLIVASSVALAIGLCRDGSRTPSPGQAGLRPRSLRVAVVVIILLASMALADTAASAFSAESGLRWTSPASAALLLLGAVGLLRRNRVWHKVLVPGLFLMWCYLSTLLFHWFIHGIPWLHETAMNLPFGIYGQPTDLPMAVPGIFCAIVWAILAVAAAILLRNPVRSFLYRG